MLSGGWIALSPVANLGLHLAAIALLAGAGGLSIYNTYEIKTQHIAGAPGATGAKGPQGSAGLQGPAGNTSLATSSSANDTAWIPYTPNITMLPLPPSGKTMLPSTYSLQGYYKQMGTQLQVSVYYFQGNADYTNIYQDTTFGDISYVIFSLPDGYTLDQTVIGPFFDGSGGDSAMPAIGYVSVNTYSSGGWYVYPSFAVPYVSGTQFVVSTLSYNGGSLFNTFAATNVSLGISLSYPIV